MTHIYEEDQQEIQQFQQYINSGLAWRLEGAYGRAAMSCIEAGQCALGLVGHRDYWGNYVPSRFEVRAGTKGSVEFVEAHGYRVQDEG